MSLPSEKYRKLCEVIEWMYEAKSMEALYQSITKGAAEMIQGDCYDLVLCQSEDHSGEMFLNLPNTYTANEIAFMLEHAGEHPFARAHAQGANGALRLSQCGSMRQWQQSALYHEGGYRRMGLLHELTIDVPGIQQSCLAAFSVVRGGRDFSATDLEILNLLRPHIARTWLMTRRRGQILSPLSLRQRYPALTWRESEILFWITEGKQNAEIAAILERRLGTVQEHVESLVHKLGVENRHQMAVLVLKSFFGME
jgi:DNA-binding CsgD family transcriptional regulator